MHVKHPEHEERKLAMVFGWEASQTILKLVEEGQAQGVFGSRANLIKKSGRKDLRAEQSVFFSKK